MTDEIERMAALMDGDAAEILRLNREIKRLRAWCKQAADEIERLERELELWKARAYAEGFVPAAERT